MSGRVLVAGFGNLLRCDDGFGVTVARRLRAGPLPPGVRVIEVGIGGIALVQELLDGWPRLLVVDAVRRGGAPGTLYLLEPHVPDPSSLPLTRRRAFLADLHQTEPSRALLLARALGVLPAEVLLLGCEPAECDAFGLELTPAVARAVEVAVQQARALAASSSWARQPAFGEACHADR
jgi:hydrogenase maturation protease